MSSDKKRRKRMKTERGKKAREWSDDEDEAENCSTAATRYYLCFQCDDKEKSSVSVLILVAKIFDRSCTFCLFSYLFSLSIFHEFLSPTPWV